MLTKVGSGSSTDGVSILVSDRSITFSAEYIPKFIKFGGLLSTSVFVVASVTVNERELKSKLCLSITFMRF